MLHWQPRECTVRSRRKHSEKRLINDLLAGRGSEGDFRIVQAPLPARTKTSFIAESDGQTLRIAIFCQATSANRGSVEILLATPAEGYAFFQMCVPLDGEPAFFDFQPQAAALSSRFAFLRPRRTWWKPGRLAQDSKRSRLIPDLEEWFFFVDFAHQEVFADAGSVTKAGSTGSVGFNVARDDPASGEFSSWSMAAGAFFPDATGVGRLISSPASRQSARRRSAPRIPSEGPFLISATNDYPMSILHTHYTPQRLAAEMAFLADHGIRRLHWIDCSDNPGFDRAGAWMTGLSRSRKACGNVLKAAAKAARKNAVELIADFKVLDLGMNFGAIPFRKEDSVIGFDGLASAAIPEMAKHPEASLQANPAWSRIHSAPVVEIAFFSTTRLSTVNAKDVTLRTSRDNVSYSAPVSGLQVTMRRIRRPHSRWTPAGSVKETGTEACWELRLSGFSLAEPFLSVSLAALSAPFQNRRFRLVELTRQDGAVTDAWISTLKRPPSTQSFAYGREWLGWGNRLDPPAESMTWKGEEIGLSTGDPVSQPGVLEPADPVAHEIWLTRMERIFAAGVDGINIRTLAHHNGSISWMKFAYAPSVLERFQKKFGREPGLDPDDFRKVREVRGEGYTGFLRKSRALADRHGKKLFFQIEPGAELASSEFARMEFRLEIARWIEEDLIHEFNVRAMTPFSPWVLEWLLPAARKKGIPVHMVTRNLSGGFEPRALEIYPLLAAQARALGYSGYGFYETANLYTMNSAGRIMPKRLAAEVLQSVSNSTKTN